LNVERNVPQQVPPFQHHGSNNTNSNSSNNQHPAGHRGRITVAEITSINDDAPALALRRPDFGTLTASYPERKLTLETGRPAKVGPELTRRAIDLIAPIGYGQRALIVAPARAGKTMLLQAIVEGVAKKEETVGGDEAALRVRFADRK